MKTGRIFVTKMLNNGMNGLMSLRTGSLRLVDLRSKRGMELVQVGILIAIAIALGIIFKDKIQEFVNNTFAGLLVEKFQ